MAREKGFLIIIKLMRKIQLLMFVIWVCSSSSFNYLEDFLTDRLDPERTYVLIFASLELESEQGNIYLNRVPYKPTGKAKRLDFY